VTAAPLRDCRASWQGPASPDFVQRCSAAAAWSMGAPGIEVGERLIDQTRLQSTFRRSCMVSWWMPMGIQSDSLQPVFTLRLDRFGTRWLARTRCASWRRRCCGSSRADECRGGGRVICRRAR
jgi:hypothetical protein